MKLIRHLTWQNMRQSRSRTLATILGIVLSAAMFTAVTTMGISLHTYLVQAEVAATGDFFIQYDYGTMEDLENLRKEPSVSKLGTVNMLGYTTFPMDYEENQREQTPYGMMWNVHQDLLNLHGFSKYPTLDDIIINFSAVLMSIILIGSVSLIYNAFSISISERTKQFGLLSSIGATRKQIRRTVYTEALYLGAVGIPIDIFFGYMGITLTLYWTHDILDGLLFNVEAYGVQLQTTPSCLSFSVAAIVAFVTVLISAWIPAHQATKITPISAIRQTQEFKIPKQGIRSGRRSQMRFGVPAALAKKYYTVQKQKYRATVISLTISMVLFVSASGFVQQLRVTAVQNSNTQNFDFMISLESPELEQKIKSHPAVKRSAKTEVEYYSSFLSEDSFTDGYQKAWNEANQLNGNRWDIQDKNLEIHYLEDDTFRACLDKYNIDSTPYFDEAHPMALVLDAQLTMYTMDDSGDEDRTRYIEPILRKAVDSISLVPSQIPTEV